MFGVAGIVCTLGTLFCAGTAFCNVEFQSFFCSATEICVSSTLGFSDFGPSYLLSTIGGGPFFFIAGAAGTDGGGGGGTTVREDPGGGGGGGGPEPGGGGGGGGPLPSAGGGGGLLFNAGVFFFNGNFIGVPPRPSNTFDNSDPKFFKRSLIETDPVLFTNTKRAKVKVQLSFLTKIT